MDPAANYKEQLELANAIQRVGDESGDIDLSFAVDAFRLAELVIALDEWNHSTR
jgi:hypothetical protein